MAPFLGGSVATAPGTMAAEVVPWLKGFASKEENVEIPLSPLMATLTPSEVVRRRILARLVAVSYGGALKFKIPSVYFYRVQYL